MVNKTRATLAHYYQDYQPMLTKELDSLKPTDLLDETILNKIVLWKTDRYAALSSKILVRLNRLVSLQFEDHRRADKILAELLTIQGIALPMASGILRFRNPSVFPVIDWRAYEMVYQGQLLKVRHATEKRPLSEKQIQEQICIYFEYVDSVVHLWKNKYQNSFQFSDIDRFLYQRSIEEKRQKPKRATPRRAPRPRSGSSR